MNHSQIKGFTLNEAFLSNYAALATFHRWTPYNSIRNKSEWRITNEDFLDYLKTDPEDNINFIWFALNFNLVSKTIFSYLPEYYTYCNDYIRWKFNKYNEYPLYFLYWGKYKDLIDVQQKKIPQKEKDLFLNL